MHISERAYLSVGLPYINLDISGQLIVPISNEGRIPSGKVEFNFYSMIYDPAKQTSSIRFTTIGNPAIQGGGTDRVPPGRELAWAFPIQKLSFSEVQSGNQAVVFAGSMYYNDGFPDSPREEVPVCFETYLDANTKKNLFQTCLDERLRLIEKMNGTLYRKYH